MAEETPIVLDDAVVDSDNDDLSNVEDGQAAPEAAVDDAEERKSNADGHPPDDVGGSITSDKSEPEKSAHSLGVDVDEPGGDNDDIAYDVVGVHGIHGQSRESWKPASPSSSETWLPSIFYNACPNKTGRVILYGYDSDEESARCYTVSGVFREAEALLSKLVELRPPEIEAMVLASRHDKYQKILHSTRGLLFFGYPHRPLSNAELEEQVLRLLSLNASRYQYGNISRLTKSLAETISEVNGAFVHTNMITQAMIVNVYSTHEDTSRRIFENFTAQLGHSTEYHVPNPKPHLELTYGDDWISENLANVPDDDWMEGEFPVPVLGALRTLLNGASPFYPSLEGKAAGLDNTELAGLSDVDEDRIIHIQCPSGAETVADRVRNYIDTTRGRFQLVLYFRFNAHDIRFSSIQAMLNSFVAQITLNRQRNLKRAGTMTLEGITARESLNEEDLYTYLQQFRLDANLALGMFVLGALDECDESAMWFLSQMKTFTSRTESRLKMVIVTTRGTKGNEAIVKKLSEFRDDVVVNLDYTLPNSVPVQVGLEASILFQENSRLTESGLQEDVAQLLSRFEHDQPTCRLLIEWLKSSQDPERSVLTLFSQSKTPTQEVIFDTILQEIPQEHRTWALKLLSWVISSLRPLTAYEFGTIAGLCLTLDKPNVQVSGHQTRPRQYLADALLMFRGILSVNNDEVVFSHPALRGWLDVLLDDDETHSPWYRQNSEQARQVDIVKTSLLHLSDESAGAGASNHEPTSQLPYITRFWTEHLKAAGSVEGVLETVFENEKTLQRWISSYTLLPTTLRAPFESNLSALPIAAHFGLEDITASLLSKHDYDSETRGKALVEAARGGQLATLRVIVKSYKGDLFFGDACLHQATEQACYCKDAEVFREIVNKIPNPPYPIPQRGPRDGTQAETAEELDKEPSGEEAVTSESSENGNVSSEDTAEDNGETIGTPEHYFAWLTRSLSGAAWRGMDDVASRLLQLGANPNPSPSFYPGKTMPLHNASRQGNLSVANVLVAAGADLNAKNSLDETPMHIAATFGVHDVIDFLAKKGASVDILDEDSWVPFQVACEWGHFETVEVLLKHRDAREYLPDRNFPVILATKRYRLLTLKALLDHDYDPNIADAESRTTLWHTVYNGKIDLCRALLEHKADPNLINGEVSPPLVQAVMEKRLDIVKLLLEYKADINIREQPGCGWQRTPFLTAIFEKDTEIALYLLSLKPDLTIRDEDDWAPLWTAARNGLTEVVKALLEAGEDIHMTCTDLVLTPLHPSWDHPETTRVLLEHGADVNKLSNEPSTPITCAMEQNHPDTLQLQLQLSKHEIDLSCAVVQKSLQNVVRWSYAEIVDLVLEAGADVNLVDENNVSLISLAVSASEATVRTILEYSPDLSIRDTEENTALHRIESDTAVSVVKLLVNAGVRVDSVNKNKRTPLSVAIAVGNEDVVKYLLTKKTTIATLNLASFEAAASPLHIACDVSPTELVQLLVEKGSDVNYTCGNMGGTPLITATLRTTNTSHGDSPEKENIVKLLLDKGANPNCSAGPLGYPIISASLVSKPNIVQLLLDHKASTDVRDPVGRKIAHLACYNSLEMLDFLNVSDSEFAVRDVVGRVPLHYAVLSGDPELVTIVLERSERVGIDINIRDNDGWTPLLWAVRASAVYPWGSRRATKHEDVVSLLLEKGASTKIFGRGLYKDWTALEVAQYHTSSSIVDLLLAHDSHLKKPSQPVKIGQIQNGYYCDCCLLEISGIYFKCNQCLDYGLCFKCYRSNLVVHPQHDFADAGLDWDEDAEEPNQQSEPAGSVDVGAAVGDAEQAPEGVEGQFDDEIVGDDDMTEIVHL